MSESVVEGNKGAIDIISMGESSMEEDSVIQSESQNHNDEENIHISKEQEVDNNENWTVVGNSEKRRRVEPIEISISSTQKLPKQFSMAKLFNSENITGITRVKYMNSFRVIISCDNEESAAKLLECQNFKEKEWRVQKTWEKNVSYGIIRQMDLDLSDLELLECIKRDNRFEILSAKRLKRRDFESGWSVSESVRICFKGNYLPPYIKIYDVNVAVVPYVFPVTQCSRCWRFGHTIKVCPSLKVICPKCGKNHPNCETSSYKCVNCRGSHMSLVKSCPAFIKEKKIRSLMAEFNCTYRRALTMYIPPFSPPYNQQFETSTSYPQPDNFKSHTYTQNNSSYKSYAAVLSTNQKQEKNQAGKVSHGNKRKQRSSSSQSRQEANESLSSESCMSDDEERASVTDGPRLATETANSKRSRRGSPRRRRRRNQRSKNTVEQHDLYVQKSITSVLSVVRGWRSSTKLNTLYFFGKGIEF